MKKPPGMIPSGFGDQPTGVILLKLIRDILELRVEGAANRIHSGYDHDRNTGGDQTVFDGGSARLVL